MITDLGPELHGAVEEALRRESGETTVVSGSRSIGGGCINDARLLELGDGRRLFLKTNPAPLPHLFEREAEGLRALESTGTLRVPTGAITGGPPPFIVMEAIASGSPSRGFSDDFGRRFAELHASSRGGPGDQQRYGFEHDNYIGSTPQPNTWADDWCEFWREHRLGFQLDLARRSGKSDRRLDRFGDRLMDRLDAWLDHRPPACLLHGDLWGGNFMVDESGAPVLIDPAAYFGDREADLAMTRLFGGFDEPFYAAYNERWPLEDGWHERAEIYTLYHLLNHLNLFGGGYRGSCLAILERLVG